jgi:hypothetical protein
MEEQRQIEKERPSLQDRVRSGEFRREREEALRRLREMREEAERHLAESQRLLDSLR